MPVNCKLGKNVKIYHPDLVNIYGGDSTIIGDNVFIGPFCEIQKKVKVGDGSRIQSHSFLCEGVEIGRNVFVGHGAITVNDLHPFCNNKDWKPAKTIIEDDVSIGSNVTLLPVKIGKGAKIGAGAVVTKNVPSNQTWAGNPAKQLKKSKKPKNV